MFRLVSEPNIELIWEDNLKSIYDEYKLHRT